MPWTPPVSAKSLVFRPLLEGVIRNLPGQLIPVGSFRQIDNYIMTVSGLKRRGGFESFAMSDTVDYTPEYLISLWESTGNQALAVMTNKTLFSVDPLVGYSEAGWEYSTGTSVTILGTTVTGVGTNWDSNDILGSDLFRANGQEAEISIVTSATQIELATASIADGTYTTYTIQRSFDGGRTKFKDYAIFMGSLIIADGKRPLITWDPSTNNLSYWSDPGTAALWPTTGVFGSSVVCTFMDRLWVGYTFGDTDGERKQRIRWSALANEYDFSIDTNWLELPYVSGELKRLVPMGDKLIAYFADGVFVGSRTNYPTLPLLFTKLETGGIGLPSIRGVVAIDGGHFFIGQDDIYFLGVGENNIVSIGTPIVREVMARCKYPEYNQVALDVTNSCIIFGFTNSTTTLEELWYLNYKTKAFSRCPVSTDSISSQMVYTPIAWTSLAGLTWATLGTIYSSWENMRAQSAAHTVYVENGMSLWRATQSRNGDFAPNTPITAVLETRDFDFDEADLTKYFVRFGIKIDFENALGIPIVFTMECSVNRGRTWEPMDDLIIASGDDEGYVNFHKSSSTIRFRITSVSPSVDYTIVEYGLRVRGGGSELTPGLQA